MITAKEFDFFKAHQQFEEMCEFVRQAGRQRQRVDQVERGLFPKAMEMCLDMLLAFINAHGDGDEGSQVQQDDRSLNRLSEPHDKRYLSIFGEIVISRYVYGTREGQAIEYKPLDVALGLPAGDNSYVLEDWLQRLCVKEAFEESVKDLQAWLGTTVSVRTAERMNREMAEYSEGYRLQQGAPPEDDEEILVVTADGKGVPMRRPLEQRLREEKEAAEKEVEKEVEAEATTEAAAPDEASADEASADEAPKRQKGKKQMAYVGSLYSIAPFVRTAEDVIDEVRRRKRSPDRPRPVQKHLWARMTAIRQGKAWPATPMLFLEMALACHQRDPERQKPLVCLMDGERQLWSMQAEWFGRAVGILDLYHALKRLWDVAHCLHGEESPEASEFVTHHLRMLLEGKVGYVLRNLRPLVKPGGLLGKKKETVESVITYYENNRDHMRYHEYLLAGYPIASGVIEGACHHFVKDRMEGAGMRWELEGAQSMLSLRALYLNDQWDDFIAYRIAQEQQFLYEETPQSALAA
jgi:hypothetical protein